MALTASSTLVGNGSGDRDRERTQSWRIHVTAKAKHLNFRFRFAAAATYAPTWTLSFFRLSLLLHLPQFVFKISSHPKQGRASLITTKVMKFFHKFRPRLLNKNQPNIAAAKSKTKTESNLSYPKDPIRVGFWVMGFVACLVQSIISKVDRVGIVMAVLASVGFFVASLLLKKLKAATMVVNLAAFLLVGAATLVCYLFSYFDCDYGYWEYILEVLRGISSVISIR